MSGRNTFYDLLGVEEEASEETVERAYRGLVKQHHPDVSDHPNARARFKRLTLARDVLCDPKERARYDQMGHASYLARRQSGDTNSDESAGTAGTRSRTQRTGSGSAGGATGASDRSSSTTSSAGTSQRSRDGRSDRASGGRSSRSGYSGRSGQSAGSARSSASAGTTGTSRSAGTADSRGSTPGGGTTKGGRTSSRETASDGWRAGGSRVSHSPRGGDWRYDERERTDRTATEEPETTGRVTDGDAATVVGLALVATVVLGLGLAVGGVVPVDVTNKGVVFAGWIIVAAIAGWMVLGG